MALPVDLNWVIAHLEYIGAAGLILALLHYHWPTSKEDVLLKRFGLNPSDWKILGHDLGRGGNPYHVKALGLVGKPDFVAKHRKQRKIKAFDYKHRTYKGQTRKYEEYQVALYCLALEQMHRGYAVEGAVRYKNKIVSIQLSTRTRNYLLEMRDQFRKNFL